jgi:hypothetical protein
VFDAGAVRDGPGTSWRAHLSDIIHRRPPYSGRIEPDRPARSDDVPRFPLVAAAILVSAAAPFVTPAFAQADGEKVNMVIIYGNDECPASSGDEITVCARKDEAERYRIPEPLRGLTTPQNEAWNNKVLAYETVGQQGTHSCSPVGPGGITGCTQQLIDRAYAAREQDPSVRFSELIEAERERRLSTIDAEADEVQARVEEAERAYDARIKAEQAQAQAAEPAP